MAEIKGVNTEHGPDCKEVGEKMQSAADRLKALQACERKAYDDETAMVCDIVKAGLNRHKHDEWFMAVASCPNIPQVVDKITEAAEDQTDAHPFRLKPALYWAGFAAGVCACVALAAIIAIIWMMHM